MATVIKAWSMTEFLSRTDSHIENVRTYVEANPGSTSADVQSGVPLNATNTDLCLEALVIGQQVIMEEDQGVDRYWGADSDWASAVRAAKDLLLTELATTDPLIIDQTLATSLGVTVAELEAGMEYGDALGSIRRSQKD